MSRECHVRELWIGLLCLVMSAAVGVGNAEADAFTDYEQVVGGSFNLPASGVFDVLGDGRLVTLVGANVYAESEVGSRSFSSLGMLPDADIGSYGAAFLRVSPDGERIAVGNNGGALWDNYQVGVFSATGLTGDWFDVNHYDAEWIDDTHLALSAGAGSTSLVTALDTSRDPLNPTISLEPCLHASAPGRTCRCSACGGQLLTQTKQLSHSRPVTPSIGFSPMPHAATQSVHRSQLASGLDTRARRRDPKRLYSAPPGHRYRHQARRDTSSSKPRIPPRNTRPHVIPPAS